MGKLSMASVRASRCPSNSRRPARFGDGNGLYLQVAPRRVAPGDQVAPRDTKSWLFRYTLHGKAREMGLGPVGEPPGGVPLAEARKLAAAARASLREGRDPIAERQERKAALHRATLEAAERTFKAAATALIESKRSGWKNAKHGAQWTATFEAHVFPVIGEMPVARIGTDDVLRVLRPIWERVPETASRVRQRIEAVLDAASVKGWRTGDNPARWRGHLAGELPQPRKVKRVAHRPALPWQQIGAFMAALAQREGAAAQALRFVILTAARTGEVRGMRWREVDLEFEGVGGAGRPHEGRQTAPRSAFVCRAGGAGRGASADEGTERSGVPRRAKERAAVRHGAIGGGAADERGRGGWRIATLARCRGAGGGAARVPQQFP